MSRQVRMPCPKCGALGAGVIDSRAWYQWQCRTRRCVNPECLETWPTLEIPAALLEGLPKLTEELAIPMMRMQALIETFTKATLQEPSQDD